VSQHLDDQDLVVLLDDDGAPLGDAPRATVHHTSTPLHLAFSCYVFDRAGRVLLTRRALDKRSWPGVWTNSFCGHPRPDESPRAAVGRRARDELGLALAELTCILPDFRYRAVDAAGVVENEVCPVWFARAASPLDPDPAEVVDHAWVDVSDLGRAVRAAPWALSPWTVAQVTELVDLLTPASAERVAS